MYDLLAKVFGSAATETAKGLVETIDMLFNRFKASPEQLQQWDIEKAKLLEQARQRDADMMVKLQEIDASDRNSARNREIAVRGNTNSNLAYLITGTMFGGMVYFNFFPPAPEIKGIVENVMMAVRDGWLIIVAYYFGSSSGSASKQAMIDRMTKSQ